VLLEWIRFLIERTDSIRYHRVDSGNRREAIRGAHRIRNTAKRARCVIRRRRDESSDVGDELRGIRVWHCFDGIERERFRASLQKCDRPSGFCIAGRRLPNLRRRPLDALIGIPLAPLE